MEITHQWQSDEWGSLSLDSIRAIHTPAHQFRISPTRILPSDLPDGETLRGASRAGRIYVLSGAVRVTIRENSWELEAGQWADLPEGWFIYLLLRPEPLEIVNVWELTTLFKGLPNK